MALTSLYGHRDQNTRFLFARVGVALLWLLRRKQHLFLFPFAPQQSLRQLSPEEFSARHTWPRKIFMDMISVKGNSGTHIIP